MIKLNNFLFYLGLFTINAFRYHWDAILIPTLIVGGAVSIITGSPWQLIPAFIGSYWAQIHDEYKQFKKDSDEQRGIQATRNTARQANGRTW